MPDLLTTAEAAEQLQISTYVMREKLKRQRSLTSSPALSTRTARFMLSRLALNF